MSEFFEIAYAAASKRLCLFTGTGFSKAVSENSAPSWQELLELVCEQTSSPVALKAALFPTNTPAPLSLEEAAQVIELELKKLDKSIHAEVASIIGGLSIQGNNIAVRDFLSVNSLDVVTTNYDLLLESLCGTNAVHSLTPGLPVPRSDSRVRIFHVHGSIKYSAGMVVTSEDYFKFSSGESYFSRKLSTILHENTVVILGYSLGDANLKSIINEYKGFSKAHVIASNIFLVSRSKVTQPIKDYYYHCYGIRVIDGLEVRDFFVRLNFLMPTVLPCVDGSIQRLMTAYFQGVEYTSDYLRSENSFYEIVSSLSAVGASINNPTIVGLLGRVIEAKIRLTGENQAWQQYAHLANWLVYLGTILEIKGTSIEEIFLLAVRKSMTTMSSIGLHGYSWDAYVTWSTKWNNIISSNRLMIKRSIEGNFIIGDAFNVVRL